MPKVNAQVTVRDPKGNLVSFSPGDNAPGWITDVVTNPNVVDQKKPAAPAKPESPAEK